MVLISTVHFVVDQTIRKGVCVKIFNIILLIAVSSIVFAETHISAGNISGTWSFEDSPYFVDGEITIPDDALLTIEPGVEIIFSDHYRFLIYGRLLAEGTQTDTICFSAEDSESGWGGLRFIDTILNEQNSSELIFCKLEDGNATQGGYHDKRGGALSCYNSSDIIINNCLFQNNSADYGGAIIIRESDILMENSVVKNNYAYHDGGGIIISSNSDATLDNIEVTDNECHYDGGGIFVCSGSAPLITNSFISGNASIDWESAQGGGISCWGGNPLITNVVVSDNFSQGGSGGLCLVHNSNPILTDVQVKGNTAQYSGGGIGIYNSIINMAGVTVSRNISLASTGGGIHFGYGSGSVFDPENRCNIYLNNSFGALNTGNDLRAYNSNTINVIVDTFTVLVPTEYYAEPIESFTFDILNSKMEPAYQDLYVSPSGNDNNTGFTAEEPLRTITFAINKINPDAQNLLTIHLAEGIYSPSNNGEIFPLQAESYLTIAGAGQGLSILDAEHLSSIMKSYYIEDFALQNLTLQNGYELDYEGGGAIFFYDTDVNISNVSFLNNQALQKGGAIVFDNCADPSLTGVVVKHNASVYNSGGGIYLMNSNASLSGVQITENNSLSTGGGIYFYQSNPVFDPDDRSSIYNNTTANSGQDLGLHNCDINVIVDTFTVLLPDEYFADPVEDFSFDIQNAIIEPVEADLYVSPAGNDENSGLSSNEPLKTITRAYKLIASNDETTYTIFLANGTYSQTQTGEIFPLICRKNIDLIGENRDFTILDAEETRRVINCNFPDITIRNLTVKNGFSDSDYAYNTGGGGINIYWADNCNLEDLRIVDNYSTGYGGGIFCSSCNPVFNNLIIENNASFNSGGGISLNYSNPVLRNLEITNNFAYNGGGIYFDNSVPVFDPEERCNIYMNDIRTGQGKDLYTSNYQNIIEVIVDTFTVVYPDNYYAYPIGKFNFDILNSVIIQSDTDMYVNPTGSNDNTGLTPEDPFKTISYAIQQIVSNSENPHTLFLAEGTYSYSATDENFPSYGKNHLTIRGVDPASTILDAENNSNVFNPTYIDDFKLQNLTIANGNSSSGGGVDCFYTDIECNNVVFRGNHSYRGGGINSGHSTVKLNNVTMFNNSSQFTGSGLYGDMNSYIVTINSIFQNEIGNEFYFPPYNGSNDCIIVYSDIWGGEESIDHNSNANLVYQNNIDGDPLFENPGDNNYNLLENSPCIDAGIAFFEWNDEILVDLTEDEYYGIAPDMGAFEFGMSSSDEEIINIPESSVLHQNFPNPFNPTTTISFLLNTRDLKDVKLEIYNIKGQKVKTFDHIQFNIRDRDEGQFSVTWNGMDNNEIKGKRSSPFESL